MAYSKCSNHARIFQRVSTRIIVSALGALLVAREFDQAENVPMPEEQPIRILIADGHAIVRAIESEKNERSSHVQD